MLRQRDDLLEALEDQPDVGWTISRVLFDHLDPSQVAKIETAKPACLREW